MKKPLLDNFILFLKINENHFLIKPNFWCKRLVFHMGIMEKALTQIACTRVSAKMTK